MRIDSGSSSGGQLSSSNEKVLSIILKARSTNALPAYVGGDDVGSGNGYELTPGESVAPDFTQPGSDANAGHVLFDSIYVNAPGPDDKVDWIAILK